MRIRSRLPLVVGSIVFLGLIVAVVVGRGGSGPTTATGALGTTSALTTPGKTTVVWFSATWCQICKTMRPYIVSTIEQHADTLVLSEHDVDREPALVQRYAVRGMPTFVLLDDQGKILSRRVGYMSPAAFESFVTGG